MVGAEMLYEAMSIVAVRCDDKNERFWIAQLLDDIFVDLLENEKSQVNVMLFELALDTKFYTLETYDRIPVQSILCEIQLDQVNPDEFILPTCHLQRIKTILNQKRIHSSSYSESNSRVLIASLGGRDKTNSMLMNQSNFEVTMLQNNEKLILWKNPLTTYEVIIQFYPGDCWIYQSARFIPHVIRCGNYKLAHRLVGILNTRGGWGYNNLHVQVLGSEPLEPFEKMLVHKKATKHNIQPLHMAAINPNPKYLEELIVDIVHDGLNEMDQGGWQAVHFAAACEGPGALKVLIDSNVNLNIKTKEKETPLTIAASRGRVDNVKLLLEKLDKTILEVSSVHGKRPLHHAAEHGHADVVQVLLVHGANINAGNIEQDSALAIAAAAGHMNVVETLLQHNVTVDVINKVHRTPLMLACMNGHIQVVTALLNAGANLNAVDTSLNTVMHYAASYGWLSCVKALHSLNASAWLLNSWGYSPMAVAALKGHYDCSRFLINNAPPSENVIDFRDADGATMLFLQCKQAESLDEIEFLLSKGADCNMATIGNVYPLQQIIQRLPNDSLEPFLLDTAKLLMKHGAHVSHDNMHHAGQPLALAMEKKSSKFFELLLPKTNFSALGANDEDLWMTATHFPVEYIEAMLKTKQTPTLKQDKYGSTIFHHLARTEFSHDAAKSIFNMFSNAEIKTAMSTINSYGDVPLMALLRQTREIRADVDYNALDRSFGQLVDLFIKNTPNIQDIVSHYWLAESDTKTQLPSTETLLHVAASRTLSDSTGWKGVDILEKVLLGGKWSKEVVDAVYHNKSALLLACMNNHDAGVKMLLEHKADSNFFFEDKEKNIEGLTPLYAAVSAGNLTVMRYLLENSASPSFPVGGKMKTPLHVALERNDASATDLLLEHGADTCAKDSDGLSALSRAILNGDSVTKEELPVNKIVLGKNDFESLNDEWDILCPSINDAAYSTSTPLPNGDDECDEKSIAVGVVESPNSTGKRKGATALSIMLQHSSVSPAIGLGDSRGRTPLHYASANRDLHLLRLLLLSSNVAVNTKDNHQRTPFHFAVNNAIMTRDATFDIESLLLMNGADVNAIDSFGFTALHFAFQKLKLDWHFEFPQADESQFREYLANFPNGESDPIETIGNLFLVRGLEVHHQDILGRTCLHLGAVSGAFVSTWRILHISNPSLLEIVDLCGDTALGKAMALGRQSIMAILIQHGADIKKEFTKDSNRCSMYYYAMERNWQEVFHMLLHAGYCRRQVVEDAIVSHCFQLTQSLIAGFLHTQDETLNQRNERGESLLHVLAQQDVPFDSLVQSIAWQLVGAGVSVDAVANHGETAMHFAAIHGNLQFLHFLLHLAPLALNTLTKAEETPLLFGLKGACSIEAPNLPKIIRTLVFLSRKGADLFHRDEDGNSVLTVILDVFTNSLASDTTLLLDLIQSILIAKVSLNGLFKTSLKIKCAPQSTEPTMRLTPLMRMIYIPSKYLREHLLALLLHHGAKIDEVDEEGNTAIMHAIVQNQLGDVKILLGHSNRAERITKDGSLKVVHFNVSNQDRHDALMMRNKYGQTALHVAIQPKPYGSYENVALVELLLSEKISTTCLDAKNQSPIDLAKKQSSGTLLSVLTNVSKPAMISKSTFAPVPPIEHDATRYLTQCKAQGLVKSVPIPTTLLLWGEDGNKFVIYVDDHEYSVFLTKIDVSSGQHGVSVFYRMQILHDQVKDIYKLFTNWGCSGEFGKSQNTPFNDAVSAINEFNTIFQSKTGNVFGATPFENKTGKYILFPSRESRSVYDAKVTAPLECNVNSRLPSTVQEFLHVVTGFRFLEEVASELYHSVHDIPIVELQPKMVENALEILEEIKDLFQRNAETFEKMNTIRYMSEPNEIESLREIYQLAMDQIAEKSMQYCHLLPRSDANRCGSLTGMLNFEITRARKLLDIAQTSQMILGAKVITSNPLDYFCDALQVHFEPTSQVEFDTINTYFQAGFPGGTNTYKVSKVLAVDRKGEVDRMNCISVPGRHTLLWHGAKKSNLMGILSRGLCVAPPEEALHHSCEYGNGLYFSDSSRKSLQYIGMPCDLSGKRQVYYMFLCDVALGVKQSVLNTENQLVVAEGTHSIFAQAYCQPDPTETIVPNFIPCEVPLGKHQEIGISIPYESAWALGDVPDMMDPNFWLIGFTSETIDLLEKTLANGLNEIELKEINEMNLKNFDIFGGYQREVNTVHFQVLTKSYYVSGEEASISCKITVSLKNNSSYEYKAMKCFQVYNSTPLPQGFKWQLQPPYHLYNEYILHDNSQTRLSYLVEIESISNNY